MPIICCATTLGSLLAPAILKIVPRTSYSETYRMKLAILKTSSPLAPTKMKCTQLFSCVSSVLLWLHLPTTHSFVARVLVKEFRHFHVEYLHGIILRRRALIILDRDIGTVGRQQVLYVTLVVMCGHK